MDHKFSITSYPLYDGLIYIDGEKVTFDHFLFEEELDSTKDDIYRMSYNKMTEFLGSIPLNSYIYFYIHTIGPVYLGVLDAFINYVPASIDSIDKAPQMGLGMLKAEFSKKDSMDWGEYSYHYTQTQNNKFFGRTISSIYYPNYPLGQGSH
ncbi:hypothetical protein [Paenibacillus ihuae]|uniref:hypothetical protein n=1 Tax=Paenibacillus ihuae TaxID=1232431 RepID=UPI0006D55595|nr:hypothetical protein [Paenibacillus ihuae]